MCPPVGDARRLRRRPPDAELAHETVKRNHHPRRHRPPLRQRRHWPCRIKEIWDQFTQPGFSTTSTSPLHQCPTSPHRRAATVDALLKIFRRKHPADGRPRTGAQPDHGRHHLRASSPRLEPAPQTEDRCSAESRWNTDTETSRCPCRPATRPACDRQVGPPGRHRQASNIVITAGADDSSPAPPNAVMP